MKLCLKCGGTERYVDGACKACKKAYCAAWRKSSPEKRKAASAAWYEANLEKRKISMAAWQKANPEKMREATAAWQKANPEKVSAKNAEYHKANPERCRIKNHNRRMKANGEKLSKGLNKKLFKLQKGKCACCRYPLDKYHLDHIMPLALDGTNTDDNIQLLCPSCNLQKHAKHPVDFMQSRGFLC